ncbi:MAG: DUF3096 domain-containing protein [Chromatiaceae bacterium]|nr:MAG: DUF3096 domain-containing protein [Chromatiaceae bacterium]
MEYLSTLRQWPLEAMVALLAGSLILLVPRLLNYAVAAYLLVVGLLGVLAFWSGRPVSSEAVIALLAGILILIRPNLLAYVVGLYLILLGLLQAGLIRF